MNNEVAIQEEDRINPFTPAAVTRPPAAAAQSDQSRAVAEVHAAMMIARSAPRDQIAAMDKILNACARPTLADAAVYTYARGGTDISGPSIRLAEAMAQSWGNISFGIRELEQRHGESQVLAYAWDMETGTRREIVFSVKHVRYTKRGIVQLEDPRDIYEAVANSGARRLRACILAIIPGDVTEAAVKQCELTMKTSADTSPETIAKMVTAFAQFGVTREQIEHRIQRRLDAIQPAQVVSLKKIYASLRDGMSQPADWFEPAEGDEPAKAQGAAAVAAILKKRGRPPKAAAAAPPQEARPQEAPPLVLDGVEMAAPQYGEVRSMLDTAKDADALDLAESLIDALPPQFRAELHDLAAARRSQLGP